MDIHLPPPAALPPPPPSHRRRRGSSEPQSPPRAPHPPSPAAQGQACQRCRQQKLRCSREAPRCSRCQRAAAVCSYPPPPDRKLLAAQRVRKSRFRPYQEPRSSAVPPALGPSSRLRSPSAGGVPGGTSACGPPRAEETPWSTSPSPSPSHRHASAASRPTPLPSPEVARLLIEMYFTRVYNATLLFHKERFLSDYAAEKLPTFLTHAVFALASIFLPPTPSKDSRIDDRETELGIAALSASDFSDHAQQWAMAATRQVMMQATERDVRIVQACQVLSLYWFSRDVSDHAHILTHLAYTLCRLMGFHVPNAVVAGGDELAAELQRRCLWSCWMTACISQENASFKDESWSEVVGLPFPTDEASFAAGKPESMEAFNEAGKVVPYNAPRRTGHTSIMGELVKLFSLWWQIQRFVRRHQDGNSSDTSVRLDEFLKLDRRLESIAENLPLDFKYSGPSSFTSPKLDPYTLFSLQSLYRLCACALHSSLVPLFSSTPPDPDISKKLVRMCAEEAVKHSVITLDMATSFLSIRPDKSRLSSMTGYAMFVSSAIQIRSLGAQGKLKTHAGHLRAAISILRELNQYWTPLRALWTKLWLVSSSAGLDINSFAINRNIPQISPAGIQTDIEQIVSPEAVSESGPGADLYTYVERREPRVISQQSSPANTGPQSGTGQTLTSPRDGHNSTVGFQISQGRRNTVAEANSASGGLGEANTVVDSSSFSPVHPRTSDHVPPQQAPHVEFDPHLGDISSDMPRPAEILQLQMTGSSPNIELFGAPAIPQTMSLEPGGAFRPTMDGFDTINGMMGINMDLNEADDDFWWTRSWGSVRIL